VSSGVLPTSGEPFPGLLPGANLVPAAGSSRSAIAPRQEDALDPCIVNDHAGRSLSVAGAQARQLSWRELRLLLRRVVVTHGELDCTPGFWNFRFPS
jgi:hypothetical protein